MKKIKETKHTSAKLEETVNVKHIIGKKVLTEKGEKIGSVAAIHIHPTELTVEGIKLRRGLLEMDSYIGEDYIRSLTEQGAILKITPLKEIVGLKVYDVGGNHIGKVKEIQRMKKTNTLLSIVVDRGILKKEFVIPKSQIKEIGAGVVLNTEIKDKE